MRSECPSCRKPLLSRRVAKCPECGAALPEAARLSGDVLKELDRETEELRNAAERKKKEAEPAPPWDMP